MTSSLAVREKEEDRATGCTTLAEELVHVGAACTEMDGEVLGEFVEQNWNQAMGNVHGLIFLVKEMKRRFKRLDRKKQVDGTDLTIRGFRSFDKWFTEVTGKSRREAYYLLETEEKKNERNAGRRTSEKEKGTDSETFLSRCAEAKKKLADIWRKIDAPFKDGEARDVKPLFDQIDPTINEVFKEFLALISPDGYEVFPADHGWNVLKKYEDEPEPPSPEEKRAKRSAAAKKTMATRAVNKAAAQPAVAAPTASLGECESCCDGTLATEVVDVSEWSPEGYKQCAKCADLHRKDARKRLVREMGVAKVMGSSLKDLVDLGGKTADLGDGKTYTFPTVADYIARVREEFLGNKRYDQTVVVENIARLEKRMRLK